MSSIPFNILAVDPGRRKCGLAVVNDQAVLTKLVVPREKLLETVRCLLEAYPFSVIVVGDRTNSKIIRESLKPLGLPVETVDENRSTLEGRYRYLKDHTKGLWRLVPIGLRTPNQPYDDYVAVVIAERFLKRTSASPPTSLLES